MLYEAETPVLKRKGGRGEDDGEGRYENVEMDVGDLTERKAEE